MPNDRSSPHRTSTSAAALIAEPAEDILRRAGIQMLGLLDLAAAIAHIPALRQALLHHAHDAIDLLGSPPIVESEPEQTPRTLEERIAYVRGALAEPEAAQDLTLRAFVHLIGQDVRTANPRRSWAEIAEILQRVGFGSATADNVRQAARSAPVAPIAPPGDEPPIAGVDDTPPSAPVQPNTAMPSAESVAPNPAAGVVGSVLTGSTHMAAARPTYSPENQADREPKRPDTEGGRPIASPRMPPSAQPTASRPSTPEHRSVSRDSGINRQEQIDTNRSGAPGHRPALPGAVPDRRPPEPGPSAGESRPMPPESRPLRMDRFEWPDSHREPVAPRAEQSATAGPGRPADVPARSAPTDTQLPRPAPAVRPGPPSDRIEHSQVPGPKLPLPRPAPHQTFKSSPFDDDEDDDAFVPSNRPVKR